MSVALLNQHWPASFWRGIVSTNTLRALMLCAMFGGLVALGVYRVQDFSSATSPSAGKSGSANSLGSGARPGSIAKSGASESDIRFIETRIGQVLFSPHDGDYCRLVLFDNQTGAFHEAGELYCGQSAMSEIHGLGTERVLKVSNAFRR